MLRPVLALFLFVALFLAACNTSGPGETNYYTGTQGLVLEYDNEFPAAESYETDPLPVILTLRNLGAIDVPYSKILISFAYDPLYINGTKSAKLTGNKLFYGRSAFYPSGDLEVFDFYDFRANKIVGLREAPVTRLSAQICYEYNTTFATEICVDVDQFLRSGKPQSCAGEVMNAASQGAPVAITQVETRNSIINQGAGGVVVRPDFVIHVQNVGTGSVLGPPQAQFEKACSLSYPPEQLNAIAMRAQVFGIELECKPQLLRLRDGEGITRCTIPQQQLSNPALLVQQNFYTAISIQATYVYKEAVSREITIHRLPGTEVSGAVYTGEGVRSKVKGYVYDTNNQIVLDGKGKPLTICQQYVADPSKAPGDIKAKITTNFSCSCDAAECREIDQNGKCFFGICPGSLECCDKGPEAIVTTSGAGEAGATGTGGAGETSSETGGGTVSANGEMLVAGAGTSGKVKLTITNINKYQLYDDVKAAASQHGIPEGLLLAMITQESTGDPTLVNPHSGATGVLQFLVPAAIDMGLCYPSESGCSMNDNRKDGPKSIRAAANYLSTNLRSINNYCPSMSSQDKQKLMVASFYVGLGCVQGGTKTVSCSSAGDVLANVNHPTANCIHNPSVAGYVNSVWGYYAEYGSMTVQQPTFLNCNNFPAGWSVSGQANIPKTEACTYPAEKRGFYEQVKCLNKVGICENLYYWPSDITPTRGENSHTTAS